MNLDRNRLRKHLHRKNKLAQVLFADENAFNAFERPSHHPYTHATS
jgi:hypothetical protein